MTRKQVFICYSHRDKKWLEEFQITLKPYVRNNQLDVWDDTRIQKGTKWRHEITRAVNRAKVAVLLVSRHFLASDFIVNDELPPLLDAAKNEGLTILWVPVSASLHESSKIEAYQALIDPSKPLDRLSKARRNEELVEIAREIKKSFDRKRRRKEKVHKPNAEIVALTPKSHPSRRGVDTVKGSTFVKFDPPLNYTPSIRFTSVAWHGNAWMNYKVEITDASEIGFHASIVDKKTGQLDPLGWGACKLAWVAEPPATEGKEAISPLLERAPQVIVEYQYSVLDKTWSHTAELAAQMSVPFVLRNVKDIPAFNVKIHDISLNHYVARFDIVPTVIEGSPVPVLPKMEIKGRPISNHWKHAFLPLLYGMGLSVKDREDCSVPENGLPVSVSYQDVLGNKFVSHSKIECNYKQTSARILFKGIEKVR